MAPSKRKSAETEKMTVEDAKALDCGVCFSALKPPIFQCDNGHALCSSCRDKLAPAGKCHVCGITTRLGYRRCLAMDHLVESIRVACPNAAHGCDARPVYYDLAGHRKACPHAPSHCPGKTCSFSGTMKQLVDHITSSHGWPCTTKVIIAGQTSIRLQDGFNFLVLDHLVDKEGATTTSTTGKFLFLLNVARQPIGQQFWFNISVICIHPHHIYDGQGQSSTKAIKCELKYSWWFDNRLFHHYMSSDLRVDCTDLSDGLPNHETCFNCFNFVVPNSALEDGDKEAIHVKASITIY
ncbi:hypothetical protein EJB05_33726 [Eragrostis curvula]|uniref:RING-type E3 ubiquitin transferase n=1 Tax=Eragrostis curvula TaxID=38414 RepID=A0A5J9U231_9POAL|nr:hypothetical protein EJB05_33726 [Eragrostis curvula]